LKTAPDAAFNSSVIHYFVLSLCDYVRHQCPLTYLNTTRITFPAVLYLYWVTHTGLNNDDVWSFCKHSVSLDASVLIAAVITAVTVVVTRVTTMMTATTNQQ